MRGFLLGLVIGALAVWLGSSGWSGLASLLLARPAGIPTAMVPDGRVREFHLEAKPGRWEIFPGLVTEGWTYNGQVPGPELRVREGDLVRVVVKNSLPVPTTVHWHGVDLNWRMDGVPGVTQEAIAPGDTFTYEFVATPAGTRMYHSHQDANVQLELGLYGALIIEPRGGVGYDVERTIILDERALDVTAEVALGQAEVRNADGGNGRGGAFAYDIFLMDGKAGSAIPQIEVKPNQRVLLRLINLGNLAHSIHLHGHTFAVVATDGNPVPAGGRVRKDTVTVGPGERADVEVVAYNPGVWMLHCHIPNHGENGMMTLFRYEGFKAVGGHGHRGQGSGIRGQGSGQSPTTDHGSRATDRRPQTTVSIPMVDNRFVVGNVTVRVGTKVEWVNRGPSLHTTTSLDGLWDSPALERRQRFDYVFGKAGQYRYICRQHLLQGMVGTITVR